MQYNGSPRLSRSEACDATQRFLTHIGLDAAEVDEPVDGVVELSGNGFVARVKHDDGEAGQGAVIALIKAAGEVPTHRILFSPSGFSGSARGLAETHAIALFAIDAIGDMAPMSTGARALMPAERFTAPYAGAVDVVEPEAANPFARTPDMEVIEDHEWLECPQCHTTHHPDANFCATCGGSVVARAELGAAPASGKAAGDRALATNPAPQETPTPIAGAAQLQCGVCGSHDIQLIAT